MLGRRLSGLFAERQSLARQLMGISSEAATILKAISHLPSLARTQHRDHQVLISLVQELYPALSDMKHLHREINHHELRLHSQNGEDGILLYIFSLIGVTNRRFVEFGMGDGRECNTANLALHFGWTGLMMDGAPGNIRKAKDYYRARMEQEQYRELRIVSAFVSSENINELLVQGGISGDIDLLSIDIDGNDYHVWKAITAVRPRVVVVEYNASFGSQRSITVPYDPLFDRHQKHVSGWYHGASLMALTKLARAKGYALVGCDRHGANAFFVASDLVKSPLSDMDCAIAYFPQRVIPPFVEPEDAFSVIQHLPFVEV